MRIGIIQSNFLPWRGYFDFIDDCDVFVFYDEVQYTKNDWRNRNRIKTSHGLRWVTVPVRRDGLSTSIAEARIDWTLDWRQSHRNLLHEAYRTAPFYEETLALYVAAVADRPELLSVLNARLIVDVSLRLGITTRFIKSGDVPGGEGDRIGRLVSIVRALGGTTYLSGPAATGYLDPAAFREAGIALEFKTYDYAAYPQLWGDFERAASILDLLMNVGPQARDYLKSRRPNATAQA